MAATLNNIGTTLHFKGEHDKAVEYHTRALDIRMERLGPRHPHVAASLNNIGTALWSKGEHDKAVEYHTRALYIRFEILGVHPQTAILLSNLCDSLLLLRRFAAAADCILCCLHMRLSNPAFEQQLIHYMKNNRASCRVDILVRERRWKDALPLLPPLDRIATLAGGGAHVCLHLTAAAEVYRQCDMPSRAAVAMRRAAAALWQHAAAELRPYQKDFENAGLCMEPDKLEANARTLEKLSSSRRVAEADMPPLPRHLPAIRGLRLPVRALFRARLIAAAARLSR